MDRDQKSAAIAELTEELKGSEAIFAVDYRGISVTQASDLRRKLAEADAVFKVVKNRLAKRAVAEAGADEMDALLIGPTALTLIKGDPVIAAKTIADFTRQNDVLEYKGGFMDGEALDSEGFQVIARLPGVDVLRGQLVGLAASPITSLVRGLGSMVTGLAIALGQIAEQGLVSGEAPAAEDAPAAAETSEAPEASAEDDDKQAESSEESEPAGEDSEDPDSETTPEEE
jgi:large subunit ribosomal protein L10